MPRLIDMPALGPILRWARENDMVTLEEAAVRLGISATRLQAWEEGRDQPRTIEVLMEVAKAYRRPLAVFFLPEPPPDTPQSRCQRQNALYSTGIDLFCAQCMNVWPHQVRFDEPEAICARCGRIDHDPDVHALLQHLVGQVLEATRWRQMDEEMPAAGTVILWNASDGAFMPWKIRPGKPQGYSYWFLLPDFPVTQEPPAVS